MYSFIKFSSGLRWPLTRLVLPVVALGVLPSMILADTVKPEGAKAQHPPASHSDAASPRQAVPFTLGVAFEAAWRLQPEAVSAGQRADLAIAKKDAARALTASPPAVEVTARTDQLNRNQGAREYEAAIVLPLWLPGEKSRSRALSEAESRGYDMKLRSAKFRTAGQIREAYWLWEKTWQERAIAQDRLTNTQALAADVARRVRAGDLARVDQHQVDGAVAMAQGALAEAQLAHTEASLQLQSLSGIVPLHAAEHAHDEPEPMPDIAPNTAKQSREHPDLTDAQAQVETAKRALALLLAQTRSNPELLVGATRERGALEQEYTQTLTLGLRFPFGGGSRQRSRILAAQADVLELESQLALAMKRINVGIDLARQRIETAQLTREAARTRSRLATETRGFVEKSFKAGESDLPTRLRVELEAAEAARNFARTNIDHAFAVSALRQALGLLPQ